MKNWRAWLTVVAATSLGAVGCGAPDNTENSVDPSVSVDEGVTDMPDPTGAGDAGKYACSGRDFFCSRHNTEEFLSCQNLAPCFRWREVFFCLLFERLFTPEGAVILSQ